MIWTPNIALRVVSQFVWAEMVYKSGVEFLGPVVLSTEDNVPPPARVLVSLFVFAALWHMSNRGYLQDLLISLMA